MDTAKSGRNGRGKYGKRPEESPATSGSSRTKQVFAKAGQGRSLSDSDSEPESLDRSVNTSGYTSGNSGNDPLLKDLFKHGYEQLEKRTAEAQKEKEPLKFGLPKHKRNVSDDEEDGQPSAKKPESGDFASRMLNKMGFKQGMGLGKAGQGRQEPIEPEQKSNRLGLGFERATSKLRPTDLVWSPGADVVSVEETIEWIPKSELDPPTQEETESWTAERIICDKKLTLDDEDKFCDLELLRKVLRCKVSETLEFELEELNLRFSDSSVDDNQSALDDESSKDFETARSKANPFETLGKHFFMNRAALKMANMDAVFDFLFTSPESYSDLGTEKPDNLLFFADVCAGPGGFSEYVLWRKQWHAHGFGFTLEGKDDFKLHQFLAGPSEVFEPFHGSEDNNSVYNRKNLDAFTALVHEGTNQDGTSGVHFMMADGGFSVDGQENIQEILSKRLYLCQFLCALLILRKGGHFICKLFDLFTPFSVGLVYLMHRCFGSVCIHKPNSSRPANSERYIICKGFLKSSSEAVRDYLYEMNLQFDQLKPNEDIPESVPIDLLNLDDCVKNYITTSNEKFAEIQCLHLAKTIMFLQKVDDEHERQAQLRAECLEYWKVPDDRPSDVRRQNQSPSFVYPKLRGNIPFTLPVCFLPASPNTSDIQNLLDYRSVFFGADTYLFLGLGKYDVRIVPLSPKSRTFEGVQGDWLRFSQHRDFKNLALQLPAETLLMGEVVEEIHGDSQKRMRALHIIDAYVIGKETVGNRPYEERMSRARTLCRALTVRSSLSESVICPIRVKPCHKAKEIVDDIEKLVPYKPRNMRYGVMLTEQIHGEKEEIYYSVSGMHFIKSVIDPWKMVWSKSQENTYCFNPKTGETTRNLKRIYCGAETTLAKWMMWKWDPENKIPLSDVQGRVRDVLTILLEAAKVSK